MQALRSLPLLLALLATALPLGAQETAPLRLDLNIPELVLRVYEGDRLLRTYPVSVGLPKHPTPDGHFKVSRAEWNPWWRPPAREWAKDDKVTPPGPNNPMGRVKLFFAPYYYLHGTPHVDELGTPASHGCVRMKNADAIALGRLLHERASPTVPSSQLDAILAKPRATRAASFRAPVHLHVRYEPIVVVDGELRIHRDIYGRNRLHPEAVYQALIAAGYDPAGLEAERVRDLLRRAKEAREPVFAVRVSDALGTRAARVR